MKKNDDDLLDIEDISLDETQNLSDALEDIEDILLMDDSDDDDDSDDNYIAMYDDTDDDNQSGNDGVFELDLQEVDEDNDDSVDDNDDDDDSDDDDESKGVIELLGHVGGRIAAFTKGRYAIAAGVAAVIVAVAAGTAVVLTIRNTNKKAASPQTSPVVAQAVVETEEATHPMPLQGMKLEAVADESSITAKILDESGSALEGHDFVVKLFSGSLDDNKEKVDKILEKQKELATQATTQAATTGATKAAQTQAAQTKAALDALEEDAMSYKDEDKNGEVVIKNLDAGTYTLLVQAEAGFEVPDATEATIVRYEVIDNIMEQVVEQDADTEKEDPQAVREAEAQQQTTAISATTLPAVTKPSVTAGKKIITITKFKKNGDEIVYTANNW